MKKIALTGCLIAGVFSGGANAVLQTEVPSNAYISIGGYDIAWAAPCPIVEPSCGILDLSYQAQFGWAAISEGLFNQLGIDAYDFVFAGANVDYATGNNLDEGSGATVDFVLDPLEGDVAVAAPWFSSAHLHIDFSNGVAGLWSFADNNGDFFAESVVFRRSQSQSVSEPATIGMLVVGLLALGLSRKKKAA